MKIIINENGKKKEIVKKDRNEFHFSIQKSVKSSIHKNKKEYTRKEKHKKSLI